MGIWGKSELFQLYLRRLFLTKTQIGIDWAGVAIERATNISLNDYIQANICQPLGLQNINMIPTASMKAQLAYMHYKKPNGEIVTRDHPIHRPLIAQSQEEIRGCFNSGGAGIFAKPQEYSRILAVFLNDGTCPITNAQILKKETVDEMFTNQIANFPNFSRQGVQDAKPELTNELPELYPVPGNPPQGWGLTFMITGGTTGRSDGTAWWAGLPNLFWWCDRQNGVAGIVCSQILPFGDPAVLGLWSEVETAVYKGLRIPNKV
ncbi:acyltransferase mlcH [Colletotrichum spaethianum]|uniref:Acyltransferase mlcH n=1 Tax=Colletotrichum spaethianum TaxID=700344 RepID=A0AA37PC94_9PEZI|nr:acyltransferase mlcH [Colletotrichum spaethianum]GKT49534.1 acyltransferase mlcH [Colletotrichum spaethianum]